MYRKVQKVQISLLSQTLVLKIQLNLHWSAANEKVCTSAYDEEEAEDSGRGGGGGGDSDTTTKICFYLIIVIGSNT